MHFCDHQLRYRAVHCRLTNTVHFNNRLSGKAARQKQKLRKCEQQFYQQKYKLFQFLTILVGSALGPSSDCVTESKHFCSHTSENVNSLFLFLSCPNCHHYSVTITITIIIIIFFTSLYPFDPPPPPPPLSFIVTSSSSSPLPNDIDQSVSLTHSHSLSLYKCLKCCPGVKWVSVQLQQQQLSTADSLRHFWALNGETLHLSAQKKKKKKKLLWELS